MPQNHQCDRYALECATLGPANPRCLTEPIAASLEALVPPNQFYRHLEATLVWLAQQTHRHCELRIRSH